MAVVVVTSMGEGNIVIQNQRIVLEGSQVISERNRERLIWTQHVAATMLCTWLDRPTYNGHSRLEGTTAEDVQRTFCYVTLDGRRATAKSSIDQGECIEGGLCTIQSLQEVARNLSIRKQRPPKNR